MSTDIKFPFELESIFFINLEFNRPGEIGGSEVSITAEGKIVETNFPRLQINLRLRTIDSSGPVSFTLECVGIFKYAGKETEYNKKLNRDFMNERAFYMLWVNARQMIQIITGQMGMNPLNISLPLEVVAEQTDS